MRQKEFLQYSLGALLYTPASNEEVSVRILNHFWPQLTSICLCLEDSVQTSGLQQAEKQLKETLKALSAAKNETLPLIFVRVRNPEHLLHVHGIISEFEDVLTGFVFPKFDLTNGEEYLSALRYLNNQKERTLYAMPILESAQIASTLTRKESLKSIKTMLDSNSDIILNVRVGGNDFTNLYGLRRKVSQSIYDLGVVRDVLVDILNVFADSYVVSGPVWEYYGESEDAPWAIGLKKELELDKANGFIGKTCIHPAQIAIINNSMRVSREDYEDAQKIIDWNNNILGVSGSYHGNRMNEVNCHGVWAKKILIHAQIFGIDEERS